MLANYAEEIGNVLDLHEIVDVNDLMERLNLSRDLEQTSVKQPSKPLRGDLCIP